MAQCGAVVELAWPRDLLSRVEYALYPLGEPAWGPADREQHGEHLYRESHGLVDDARVEVHVRVELVVHEILVVECDPLEFQRDIEQGVPRGGRTPSGGIRPSSRARCSRGRCAPSRSR